MFNFTSYFRGSKNTITNDDIQNLPKHVEINVNAVEDEDEFMEITTRRKTYLEIAKEALYRQSPLDTYNKNGIKPTFSIVTSKKKQLKKSHDNNTINDDELIITDMDIINYNLKKSDRHILKLKNKKPPSYYKELKSKRVPTTFRRRSVHHHTVDQ